MKFLKEVGRVAQPALISGLKVAGYVILSVFLAIIVSDEFKSLLESYGWYAMYGGVINIVLVVLAKIIKEKCPDLLVSKVI